MELVNFLMQRMKGFELGSYIKHWGYMHGTYGNRLTNEGVETTNLG